jgi:hypothetical protein
VVAVPAHDRVVEQDGHNRDLLADGRLELRHRHREAAVACEGDDGSIAVDQARGDRGRQGVAHGAGRRAEERAGPPEPEVTGDPQPEVAGIGGDDRVVGHRRAPCVVDSGPGVVFGHAG